MRRPEPSAVGPAAAPPRVLLLLMGAIRGSKRTVRFLSPAMLAVALCLPALTGCQRAAGRPARLAAPVRFVDAAAGAGIHFRHTNGQSGRSFAAETMGSGCAFPAYAGDGPLHLFPV